MVSLGQHRILCCCDSIHWSNQFQHADGEKLPDGIYRLDQHGCGMRSERDCKLPDRVDTMDQCTYMHVLGWLQRMSIHGMDRLGKCSFLHTNPTINLTKLHSQYRHRLPDNLAQSMGKRGIMHHITN